MTHFEDLAPMLLHEKSRPFDSPDYLFELKFDGYRLLAEAQDGRVQLKTRHGTIVNTWFPEVVKGLAALPPRRHVLDGEVAILDDLGRSNFERLQQRALRRGWYRGCDAVTFCVFDLLVHAGEDVMGQPLRERKQRLKKLLTPRPPSTLFVSDIPEQGIALFERAAALKLEGIVGKRADSIYVPSSRAPHWIKVKRPGWSEDRSWQR